MHNVFVLCVRYHFEITTFTRTWNIENFNMYIIIFLILYGLIILSWRYTLTFGKLFLYLEGSYYEFLRKSVGLSSEELTIAVQRMMKGMIYKIVRSRWTRNITDDRVT